ncbi:hypothetical protein [Aestuariibius sp. HNIBRBA575]|uniref:hypothetical protein n=1 Tax=Aestuariibius sp. HNIBRBA575 TaxID=3233343 RepID=UPI0034A0F03B
MRYNSLNTFKMQGKSSVSKGPVGLILIEDDVEIDSTIRHHLECGFAQIIVFSAPRHTIDPALEAKVIRVDHDMLADNALTDVVNTVIDMAPKVWLYYCYNTEYLFFPFSEHRTVGEMVAFSTEERRFSILTYVVDLYAGNLDENPNAVSIQDAYLDKSGYYSLARMDSQNNALDRQLDFFGGLRWRFEEHIPKPRRRIDRIALFRAQDGLRLNEDHTFNEPEYNTYSCPWHHNLTVAICSFRTAKALKRNPGSTFEIQSFHWHNSAPFSWHSQQLLDLGLMEPGQWF